MIVHGAEPVFEALSNTVETLFEFHHERSSRLGVCLEAGSHLDVDLLLDVNGEERCLRVQYEHFVVDLGRDGMRMLCSLQAGAKVPPQSIPSTSAHPSTTRRLLKRSSVLIVLIQREPTTFCSEGTEDTGTSS